VVEYPVSESDAIVGDCIRELGLPRAALVSVIVRGDDAIPPRGSTSVQAGDHLHILVQRDLATEVDELFERWRRGPVPAGSGLAHWPAE
jgi:cell volume regulation protein A